MCQPDVKFFMHTKFTVSDSSGTIMTTHVDESKSYHKAGDVIDVIADKIIKINLLEFKDDKDCSFRELQVIQNNVVNDISTFTDRDLHALYHPFDYKISDFIEIRETYHMCPANQNPDLKS